MNPVTKTIGAAFLNLGNRLRYGSGATEGDFTTIMLPKDVDPRSQKGAVIRILSSVGSLVAFQYVCSLCGTNNTVEVFNIERKCTCQGGCGKEFSIRALSTEAIKRARLAANTTRAANISAEKPVTPEEFDNWLYALPEHKPSLVTDPRQNLAERLNNEFRVTDETGAVEWTGSGSKHTDEVNWGVGFANPR